MKTLTLALFVFLSSTCLILAEDSSLNAQLSAMKAGMSGKIDENTQAVMAKAAQRLIESDIISKAVNVEDDVPYFSLPDQDGEPTNIRKLYKEQPVIIVFYRGGWCPYCNLTLSTYQEYLDEFEEAGAVLVAISPEKPDEADKTTTKNKLGYRILRDNNNKVARMFGIAFELTPELQEVYLKFGIDLPKHNGVDSQQLPLAATYIVNTEGKIAYAFLSTDYTKRAEPETLLTMLKMVK